jgi:beta-glucanase (GH16 family)
MKKVSLLFCLGLSLVMLAKCDASSNSISDKNWVLVWEDQFTGSALNTEEWRITEQGLNYNNEDQAYVKEQVAVNNGNLVLTCDEKSWYGPTGRSDVNGNIKRNYVSGEVNTIRSWTYGKFEVRAYIPPKNQGILSAAWMTPADGDWPPEIDIVEILGHDPSTAYFTNHYGTASNHQMNSGKYHGSDFTDDYHIYAVEWEPGVIRWYVDGIQRFQSKSGVPDEPFILRISLPVGPDWEKNPDNTSKFPQDFKIDWVKVYQRET